MPGDSGSCRSTLARRRRTGEREGIQSRKGDDNMRVMVLVKATKESEAGEMPSETLLSEMMH
jgi:hypothetical protein